LPSQVHSNIFLSQVAAKKCGLTYFIQPYSFAAFAVVTLIAHVNSQEEKLA